MDLIDPPSPNRSALFPVRLKAEIDIYWGNIEIIVEIIMKMKQGIVLGVVLGLATARMAHW